MRFIRSAMYLAALATAAPAMAQTIPSYTYPSAGTPPMVQLQCTDAYTACLPITSANPVPTRSPIGTANLATNQVSVTTAATLVAAARAGRTSVTTSVGAANNCYVGNSAGVTAANGFALQPVAGATITLNYAGALYAVCTATTTISVVEQF